LGGNQIKERKKEKKITAALTRHIPSFSFPVSKISLDRETHREREREREREGRGRVPVLSSLLVGAKVENQLLGSDSNWVSFS